jgi:hypothetical protein
MVFLHHRYNKQGISVGSLVYHMGYDRRLRDQTAPRGSVLESQRPYYGRGPCARSKTRKNQRRRRQSRNKQENKFGTARKRSGNIGVCWEWNPGPSQT